MIIVVSVELVYQTNQESSHYFLLIMFYSQFLLSNQSMFTSCHFDVLKIFSCHFTCFYLYCDSFLEFLTILDVH